ncbi:hypothetical protein ZIOFF_041780 [Zingiber officinale]|uniref:Deoxyuridine 5'-triphosphate nucleotidohydrolase n=1 Tax=Zingiber officinale TaxID=94328 RepID=A0A8J5L5K9_ZINOF|nr:hypothetical protein ZIOFF_041780 [Zingiber officinale]
MMLSRNVLSDKGKMRRSKGTSGCPMLWRQKLQKLFKNEMWNTNVMDIEDLVQLGSKIGTCPYYGACNMVPSSDIILLPYQSLFLRSARESLGAVGYDLAINRAQDIPAYGRSLLSTGLSIKAPEGTYARIAPRSGVAFRKGVLIGAGVVESDYRGEVQILAFNITDQDIFLQKHECIAQMILEHISTPEVMEVDDLDTTIRGEARPWPSVHPSIDYPITGEEEFIVVLSQQNTDSDAENLQCSLNSYYYDIAEDGGEMELPYPIKIIPEIIAKQKQSMRSIFGVMLDICKKNGMVLSPSKMKIAVKVIKFLGPILGNRKVKLEPHVIKKIIQFNEEDLTTKKGLRSWLGILNYDRNYIPNLGKLLIPLYTKTSSTSEKRMNQQD